MLGKHSWVDRVGGSSEALGLRHEVANPFRSTQSGSALPQRRGEDRRRFGSSCIGLQSPCRSKWVALKDKISSQSASKKHWFSKFIQYSQLASCRETIWKKAKEWEDVCARRSAAFPMSKHTCWGKCHYSRGRDVWSWYFSKSHHDTQPLCHVFFFSACLF